MRKQRSIFYRFSLLALESGMNFGGHTQTWLRRHCVPMGNFYTVLGPVSQIIFELEIQRNSPTAAIEALSRKLGAWEVD